MKEVRMGHFAGPFNYNSPPYEYFIQSPIGLVPKDGGRDTRLIFHLSYPRGGLSVNSQTPVEYTKVSYPDFSEAIIRCLEELEAGVGLCAIAKSDMMSAFRNLGISPQHFKYLLMVARSPLDGKWYMFLDKALPFGAAVSCCHFQRFSNSIAHVVRVTTSKSPVNFLDDIFFVAVLRVSVMHRSSNSLIFAVVSTFLYPWKKPTGEPRCLCS